MKGLPTFSMNQADVTQIFTHLRDCDADFIPPLSRRTNIQDFASKIFTLAIRFEAWSAGRLVGLVAVYGNDVERVAAFITNVSVAPDWQGMGIASKLLARALEHIRTLAFRRVELEVSPQNAVAIAMYENLGFQSDQAGAESVLMHAELEGMSK